MSTVLHLLNFLFVLLEVVVLFNLIIIVHELGHFLAARWRGLKIEEFGVWFGKPLWKKEINGVVYSLGSIPAGGFVKLPQLAPMDMIEGEADVPRETLPPISAFDKTLVAFAGPLFSFLFAILLACAVWVVGKPVYESDKNTTIGYVEPGSPAEKAGLLPGDRILKVDGHPVKRFTGMINSVSWFVIRSEGEKIAFEIDRNGKTLTVESGWIKESHKSWERAGLRAVQIAPALSTKIGTVEPNTPAAEAGLQPGDTITHVNGTPIFTPEVLLETLIDNPDKPVALTIQRGAESLHFSIQPKQLPSEQGKTRPRIGIAWDRKLTLDYPTPTQQIVDSVSSIGNMLGALFSPKSDVKAQHFSGPVGIGRIYYAMFEDEQGWRKALWFSVFFNVNLALLNLLPFPILDGGHILLAFIEGIRRKPVNIKVLEAVQSACALLLIGFILYVSFFDIQDLPWRKLVPQKETPATTGK
ncbi:MAG: RIP metalloprotease RseP [Verrucomicrobiota bacterium]